MEAFASSSRRCGLVVGDEGDDTRMLSALSHEFRKLDGVLVTDTEPSLEITCVVMRLTTQSDSATPLGYACSVAVTNDDKRLITHSVKTAPTIEVLAHEIAISLDGDIIEEARRATQPSSSLEGLTMQLTAPGFPAHVYEVPPVVQHPISPAWNCLQRHRSIGFDHVYKD
jgi:hypothetical protein